jgi:hypothetical protein
MWYIIIIIIPWLLSTNELYRTSDRRLLAKFVAKFVYTEVSRSQLGKSLTAVISIFYSETATLSVK